MKIIIAGCGRVGSTIAATMIQSGHEISIIDRNPLSFNRLDPGFNGKMIVGTAIDEDVLIAAGIENTDGLIAVTKGDNTNIMIGQIAKFIFKVPKVMVRIVDLKVKKFYEEIIGLPCFCPPEVNAAHYIHFLKEE